MERFVSTASDDADEFVETHPTSVPDPESLAAANELAEKIGQCLDGFTEQERRFVLLWVELDSAPAAQAMCGWPKGDKTQACHKLRRILERLRVPLRRALDAETPREFEGR